MNYRIRRNTVTAQHVDVALVYKEMLGIEEAMAYLVRENIPESIAERVLHTGERRRRSDSSTHSANSVQPVNCRRKNHLHDAIVEAAVKIEVKLGRDWAISLLKQEEVPAEVAERILAQGPRQLRRRKNAS